MLLAAADHFSPGLGLLIDGTVEDEEESSGSKDAVSFSDRVPDSPGVMNRAVRHHQIELCVLEGKVFHLGEGAGKPVAVSDPRPSVTRNRAETVFLVERDVGREDVVPRLRHPPREPPVSGADFQDAKRELVPLVRPLHFGKPPGDGPERSTIASSPDLPDGAVLAFGREGKSAVIVDGAAPPLDSSDPAIGIEKGGFGLDSLRAHERQHSFISSEAPPLRGTEQIAPGGERLRAALGTAEPKSIGARLSSRLQGADPGGRVKLKWPK
jgi:hypothetical protein